MPAKDTHQVPVPDSIWADLKQISDATGTTLKWLTARGMSDYINKIYDQEAK